MTHRIILTAAIVVAAPLFIGCGGRSESKLPTVNVSGNITVDGKPFKQAARISVTPKDPNVAAPNAEGFVNSDGTYGFYTYGTIDKPDGLPEGSYSLKIGADAMSGPVPEVVAQEVTITAGQETLDLAFKGTGKTVSALPQNPAAGGPRPPAPKDD